MMNQRREEFRDGIGYRPREENRMSAGRLVHPELISAGRFVHPEYISRGVSIDYPNAYHFGRMGRRS